MSEIPENVEEVIQRGIYLPEDISDEVRIIYERAFNKTCMLCESPLRENTTLTLNGLGVLWVFCSQLCHQDFVNMHYLTEQYDDMAEAAKFRNQEGNN